MGAYSPAPVMTPALVERTLAEIVRPTLAAMQARGAPFRGVLYAGLMLTADGPQLDRVQRPLRRPRGAGPDDAPRQRPPRASLRHRPRPPRRSHAALERGRRADRGDGGEGLSRRLRKRQRNPRLERAEALPGVKVFQAGTARRDGGLVANGGRVLNVTARGSDHRRGQGARLRRGRRDRLAGGLLPPRHRLASSLHDSSFANSAGSRVSRAMLRPR